MSLRKSFAADFGADVRFQSCFLGGQVKARGAVEAVAVEQCYGGHAERGADRDQVLGQGGTFEEAEGRTGVEFDVHQGSGSLKFKLRRLHRRRIFFPPFFSVPLCLCGEGVFHRELRTGNWELVFSVIRPFHKPVPA